MLICFLCNILSFNSKKVKRLRVHIIVHNCQTKKKESKNSYIVFHFSHNLVTNSSNYISGTMFEYIYNAFIVISLLHFQSSRSSLHLAIKYRMYLFIRSEILDAGSKTFFFISIETILLGVKLFGPTQYRLLFIFSLLFFQNLPHKLTGDDSDSLYLLGFLCLSCSKRINTYVFIFVSKRERG